MSDIVLEVEVRERTGTGGARAARRQKLIPGVIYGGGKAPVAISLRENQVFSALNSGDLIGSMVKISHKGKPQSVITKEVQFHPVKDMPLHIDFYRVEEDTVIMVEVPVHVVNEEESPGFKRGGAINMVRHMVEVNCPAGSIPEYLEIDLTGLEIGDSLHESALKLPKGVELAITDRDPTVVTIAASRTEKADEEEVVEGEEAEGAEGAEAAEGADGEDEG